MNEVSTKWIQWRLCHTNRMYTIFRESSCWHKYGHHITDYLRNVFL